ncbi:hypothetical protein [Pseudarthrobacter sp. J47]|uniref:hypothetical protein n=1 Tax=Pseudarthrobacter sp. J47 TaxID=3116482 RepID=UPI002E80DB8B|nr:hypothetical protein [Pseudarthrobacter sp. J47]MEE2521544.1 hypothetical protein [Pseudarthrobacter sp. J47]
MTSRPIIDAGPGLNFFSINQERLLLQILGPLCAPETVRDEVLRKASQDSRFERAEAVWRKLGPKWLEILSDANVPELNKAVTRISQIPMPQRMRNSRDLGETMVIAHAVVMAESGHDITVLIDDGAGSGLATIEARRLTMLREDGRDVGSLKLINTVTVLEKAVTEKHVTAKGELRTIYRRLRELDDGLLPIERTTLLPKSLWP